MNRDLVTIYILENHKNLSLPVAEDIATYICEQKHRSVSPQITRTIRELSGREKINYFPYEIYRLGLHDAYKLFKYVKDHSNAT